MHSNDRFYPSTRPDPYPALLVKRQEEIDNFVPKDYWELKTVYRDVTFSAQGKSFDSQEKAMALVEKLSPLPFEVTDFSKKKGSEAPPRLYDLTSLQVDCNKKLGIGVDDSLKIIQSLYEKKVSTYPRVTPPISPTTSTRNAARRC